jgi:hypothetical protein
MRSNRNRAFLKNTPPSDHKDYLAVISILPNLIFVAVIIAAYWYMYTHYLFTDYINYIYWTVNVLVTYNIIAASARSIIPPILALITAAVVFFAPTLIALTMPEFYQLLVVGIIGVIVSIVLVF